MEMSHGNSLYSCLKQTCHFLFYQIRKQEGRTGPVGRVVAVGGGECGERVLKGENSANTVHTCM
jgi:hypothetical protein